MSALLVPSMSGKLSMVSLPKRDLGLTRQWIASGKDP